MNPPLAKLVQRHPRSRRVKRTHRLTSVYNDSTIVKLHIPVLEANETASISLADQIQQEKVALYLYGYGRLLGCFDRCEKHPNGQATLYWEISQDDIDAIRLRLGKQPLVVVLDAFIDNPLKRREIHWQYTRAYITTRSFVETEKAFANEQTS